MTDYQKEQFPIPTPGRLRRELRLGRPLWWMVLILAVVVAATGIPLYLISQARRSYSTLPRVHFIQDMDVQPGYRPQQASEFFADGRATRGDVAGTVARGELREDDHLYRGHHLGQTGALKETVFFKGFPKGITVDERFVNRGRERYAIYCTVCHDDKGSGNGIVHERALALKETKWVPPTNLLTQEIRDRPEGQLFQAISDGVRNMPSYKSQISVVDRWAIVAHLRALQAAQPVAIPAKAPQAP